MIWILVILIVLYVLSKLWDIVLEFLNYRHLRKHGHEIPPELEGSIDSELLRKTSAYTAEKIRFKVFSSAFDDMLLPVFIFTPLLTLYSSWLNSLDLCFVLTGLLFFVLLSAAGSLIEIPFSLYSKFRIEKKYGFNTMTLALWVRDFIKTFIISLVFVALLASAAFAIVQWLPDLWWLPVWAAFLIFTLFVMYISPYVLEPLFNKFIPVDDPELEEKIKSVLGKAGIKVDRVFKMDASARTKHTNAYFSGIGRVKRIVLYDTLLEKLKTDEILAVLAHEAGHWKKKHIIKMMFIFEIFTFFAILISFYLLHDDILGRIFFIRDAGFFTQLVLLSFAASPFLCLFFPFTASVSRAFEREADDFAAALIPDGAESLSDGLIKLSRDNLSNLHPHPLYVFSKYSHPPVIGRIRRLKAAGMRNQPENRLKK